MCCEIPVDQCDLLRIRVFYLILEEMRSDLQPLQGAIRTNLFVHISVAAATCGPTANTASNVDTSSLTERKHKQLDVTE
jgi:hypothetical protein